jgi:hypothetical protein
VIDLSAGGVLVEGEARLLPGTRLEVHVIASSGRTLVRGRVVRACVAGLWSDRVLYRGALAFDHPMDLPPAASGTEDPAPGGIESLAPGGAEGNTLPSALSAGPVCREPLTRMPQCEADGAPPDERSWW